MTELFPATEAADLLVARRVSGIRGERLPAACRPQDLEQALAIQAAVSQVWCDRMDDSIGGWKCLLPPADNKWIVAPIYTRTIDTIPPLSLWPGAMAKGLRARVEPELAFFFGCDLPPRPQPYSPAEVDAAITRTHMALELIGSRFADPDSCSFPEMLADGLVNQGLFIGPALDDELARHAGQFEIRVECANGEQLQRPGEHPNGAPRAPLYWLVEFLRQRGQGIVAGQAVITGSYAGVIDLPLDCAATITYAGLGSMQVYFSAKTAS